MENIKKFKVKFFLHHGFKCNLEVKPSLFSFRCIDPPGDPPVTDIMHNHAGKVLPEVPDLDTQLALSAKMIDKKTSTPKVHIPSFIPRQGSRNIR